MRRLVRAYAMSAKCARTGCVKALSQRMLEHYGYALADLNNGDVVRINSCINRVNDNEGSWKVHFSAIVRPFNVT